MPKGVYNRKPDDGFVPAPSLQAAEVTAEDFRAKLAELEREREEIAALKARLEVKAEIRTEVSEALKLQQEEAKRQAFAKMAPQSAPPMPPKPDEKLVSMKLERHYVPRGYHEIVGYHKEALFRKNAVGELKEVEPAAFIVNEKKPPAIAGVGFLPKIWAGTVVRLPETEAREVKKAGIATVELVD